MNLHAFGWLRRGASARIKPGICDAGKVVKITAVTDCGMSDMRAWRYSVGVQLRNGTTNLLTEQDLEPA